DRAELAASQSDLRMQTTGLEQVMHLLRQAMHLVQEQKPLRFEVVQFYQSLLCQRMSFRHECKQRFVAQRFASQRWTLLASRRQNLPGVIDKATAGFGQHDRARQTIE